MASTALVKERPTATELRRRADEARRAANKLAAEAESKVAQAERAARGPDGPAKLRAERDLPALRVAAPDLRAEALDATAAYQATEPAWRAETFAEFKPRIVAKARKLIAALEAVRDRELAELLEETERARANGVPASTLPLAEMTFPSVFARGGGESTFERCVAYLRRHKWV